MAEKIYIGFSLDNLEESMRLTSESAIFNMGDTSIRVKQVVDVNKVILKELETFKKTGKIWENDKEVQEEFYRQFIEEIMRLENEEGEVLFQDFVRAKTYTLPPKGKMGLRGRTLTNTLVKAGFIDAQRNLREVGRKYLEEDLAPADRIEALLGLSQDNLVYLRQYLKLRIYDNQTDDYFYNFRFAIKFLTRYDDVPEKEFLKIIESIRPSQTEEEIREIIDAYGDVAEKRVEFDDFYKKFFTATLRLQSELDEVREMFQKEEFTDENFMKYFPNRDSKATSLLYKEYVLALIGLKRNYDNSDFEKVKKLSKNDKIKKAFGENRIPLHLRKGRTLEEFLEDNKDNPLLSDDTYLIYETFIFSKHNDLIREYKDMCRRTFQITGLIHFENGIVNLNNKWLFTQLLESMGENFTLHGNESYAAYEESPESPWYRETTMCESLGITEQTAQDFIIKLQMKFGAKNLEHLMYIITDRREKEYRDFVEKNFPEEKTIKILHNIVLRKDKDVFKEVTDNATVPTIYEYIMTIAWYHLSGKKDYMLHKSFQVSLDANKLPLTHRGGGAGDIEILAKEYALLIEVTLMKKNNQRRAELEPVIRHSVNFALENQADKKPVQTLFIANELDNNVMNVFRAMQFVELNGTTKAGTVDGLNIFSLKTEEVIELLKKKKCGEEVLQIVRDNLDAKPGPIKNHWREPIVDEILK